MTVVWKFPPVAILHVENLFSARLDIRRSSGDLLARFCHLKGITINPTSGGSVTATLVAAPSQAGDADLTAKIKATFGIS